MSQQEAPKRLLSVILETEIDWKPAALPEPQKIKPIHLEALEGFIRFGGDGA